MLQILVCLLVVAVAAALTVVVHLIRSGRLPRGAIAATTVVCCAGLLAMIVTDWPLGDLSEFWAGHTVVAGVLSSVLLVGVVFLVYERGEQRKQEALAQSLSGAGVGGIVDHIIDVEVALGLLSAPTDPGGLEPQYWSSWKASGKPLRWLREGRTLILNSPTQPDRDPRRLAVASDGTLERWGPELIDQSIRRLLAAMRDWSSLVGASKNGIAALILLSKIRSDMMELLDLYPSALNDVPSPAERRQAARQIVQIRTRLRILAAYFEDWSGAARPRRDVLSDSAPLPPVRATFDDTTRSLAKELHEAGLKLGFGLRRTSLEDVRVFARLAHAGQVDELGRDYYSHHLLPVASKLARNGPAAEIAGLLHNILEDTAVTAPQLRDLGIPAVIVRAIESVTRRDGEAYGGGIKRAAADDLGCLVKLADIEVNLELNDALTQIDPQKAAQLMAKYQAAREALIAGSR